MRLPDKERLMRGRAAVICCPDPGCKKCVSACAFSAIRMGEDGLPYSEAARCVGCGGCAAICPRAAVFLIKARAGGEYEFTVPFEGELPEIDDRPELELPGGAALPGARVVQVIPKRPNSANALVRAAAAMPLSL